MQERLITKSLPLRKDAVGIHWLYLGDAENQLGQIIGAKVPVSKTTYEPALEEVQEVLVRTFSHVCLISNVFVHADLLNMGYGIQLYTDLAKLVAKEHRLPILSLGCTGDAMRVWKSRRMAEQILVRGLCAWGGERPTCH